MSQVHQVAGQVYHSKQRVHLSQVHQVAGQVYHSKQRVHLSQIHQVAGRVYYSTQKVHTCLGYTRWLGTFSKACSRYTLRYSQMSC